MTEFKMFSKKILAEEKITIPSSPFLNRLGYGTGVELSRSPRAVINSPWAYKLLSKRVKPNKDSKIAEANILKRISHSNIAEFRMSSKHSKIQYLAMESSALFLGEMMERKIGTNYEPFLPKQILKVAADTASALDYLHTKVQILHGDIKSYNILVKGKFEICKLCDFTVTLPLDENGVFDKKKAGQAVYSGTDAWSAPEVIHGGEISCKTDIWSLGLTLWEMLTLMPPHAMPTCTCGQSSTDDNNSLGDSVNDSLNDSISDSLGDSLNDSLNDSISDSLGDSLESVENYFTGRYGTRPAVPENVSEKQFMHPLTLFYWCTETEPTRRLTAQHMCAAAKDMLNHLRYGVWFPHLNHGETLCLKS